jgi:WD40 repeat protein
LPTWTSATFPTKDGEASVLRFSPDGKILALGMGGRARGDTVRLLDARTMKELPTKMEDRSPAINTLAFSADGRKLAAASGVFTKKGEHYVLVTRAYVWDVESRKKLAELGGQEGSFLTVCFSPDATMLAAGANDGTVKIWDIATAKRKLTLAAYSEAVRAIAFSADGKRLFSGGEDGGIHITEVSTGEELGVMEGHSGRVERLFLLKDGKTLVELSAVAKFVFGT